MREDHRRGIVAGCVIGALVLGSFGTVYANQSIKWASVSMTTQVTDDTVYLPSHDWLRGASLGYGPFAGDMLFVRTHAYFLRHMYGDQIFRWLDPYVDAIVALDPDNKEVYYWAAKVVRYGQIIDEAVLMRSNRFAELGIEKFPDDSRLYAHLGFNKYFELRPIYRREERALAARVDAMGPGEERATALEELGLLRKRRYELERGALHDYTLAAMLPDSTVDPFFLVTLYVKQDERAAAAALTKALIVDAPQNVRDQLLAKLEEIGESDLAERLREEQNKHKTEMPYVGEDLFRFLGSREQLKVPATWNQLSEAYDKAIESLDAREKEELN
ncbi:MAG: hypothetical protein ACI9OJ_000328 [Myxococcota bacterium]|jgi:hypothetical protein